MTSVIELATIAALRAYSGGTASPVIWIRGYSSIADGGEGMFTYVSGSTASDNGGTIIVDASSNRWFREYNKDPINLFWFGAKSDGTTDNSSALNAALAAIPATGGQIKFPAGKFLFSSAITYTLPTTSIAVSFVGDGPDVTTLFWPNTTGFTVNTSEQGQRLHFRDMTFTTGAANRYTGVTINAPAFSGVPSDFYRVNFTGDATVSGSYWNVGLYVYGLSNVSYVSCVFYGSGGAGIGLTVSGLNTTPYYTIVHNLSMCSFYSLGVGFYYGTYVQGVTISQCNFTNGEIAILLPSSDQGESQLTISSCQLEGTGNLIEIGQTLSGFFFTGNLLFIPTNSAGIALLAPTQGSTITGNTFTDVVGATNTTGISMTSGSTNNSGVIVGNTFGTTTGIYIGTSVSTWNVQANLYSGVTTKVVNLGTGNSIGIATD